VLVLEELRALESDPPERKLLARRLSLRRRVRKGEEEDLERSCSLLQGEEVELNERRFDEVSDSSSSKDNIELTSSSSSGCRPALIKSGSIVQFADF